MYEVWYRDTVPIYWDKLVYSCISSRTYNKGANDNLTTKGMADVYVAVLRLSA